MCLLQHVSLRPLYEMVSYTYVYVFGCKRPRAALKFTQPLTAVLIINVTYFNLCHVASSMWHSCRYAVVHILKTIKRHN